MSATSTGTGPATEHADVVVVGGGAAGLSCALVLARARRDVLVLDAGGPRNAAAEHAHGYLTREGIAPAELLRLGREEVLAYGGRVEPGSVDAVVRLQAEPAAAEPAAAEPAAPEPAAPEPQPDGEGTEGVDDAREGFEVRTVDGRRVRCRALVVCTGLSDELPDVPGLRERWGRDVLHCPYCHGREVSDRRVGVLATSPGSFHQARLVRQWCDDVVVLAHGLTVDDGERRRLDVLGVPVEPAEVVGLEVDGGALRGVRLAGGDTVALQALFVGPQFRGTDTLLLGLGASTERRGEGSWVVVDDHGRTSVPGLYAAGNVADPAAQVVDAVAAGSRAGVGCNGDLVDADVEAGLERAGRDAGAP